MPFSYIFPRPAVTADCLIIRQEVNTEHILLIMRDKPPFEGMWALPGGFMEPGESLLETAGRELEEETGLRGIKLSPFRLYDKPGRDPRGRTLTMTFYGFAGPGNDVPKASSDARKADWFPVRLLPALAFDHADIIGDFLQEHRQGAHLPK